jgi:hypothetical protein
LLDFVDSLTGSSLIGDLLKFEFPATTVNQFNADLPEFNLLKNQLTQEA